MAQAAQQKVDGTVLRVSRYQLAFLHGDTAEMAAKVAGPRKAGTKEYYFPRSRTPKRITADCARRAKCPGAQRTPLPPATWPKPPRSGRLNDALRENDFGYRDLARKQAEAALSRASGKQVWILAALTFARAGDEARAEALTRKLEQDYPSDMLLRSYWLPVIRGASALERGEAAKAVELLQPVIPYDMANPFPISSSPLGNMYSVYVRGQAYLQNQQAALAAGEFQKILAQRGTVLNAPIGTLARLQLARAYALSGDKAKARTQYQDFFHLWKDADPDVTILKQAKAEYAKLP